MTASGAVDARNISRILRDAGARDLQRKMTKAIRASGERELLPALRAAALALPDVSVARRRDGASARQAIARALMISVRQTGIRVTVNRKKMPEGSEALPAAFEKGTFRHPVFARGSQTRGEWKWVQQTSKKWFRPTVYRHQSGFVVSVREVIEDIISELERR